jgi:hypothetical protein
VRVCGRVSVSASVRVPVHVRITRHTHTDKDDSDQEPRPCEGRGCRLFGKHRGVGGYGLRLQGRNFGACCPQGVCVYVCVCVFKRDGMLSEGMRIDDAAILWAPVLAHAMRSLSLYQ